MRLSDNKVLVLRDGTVRGVINEFVTNGALPVLTQILARPDFEVHLRIRVAAAICNLAQAKHSQRRSINLPIQCSDSFCSFFSCDAVPLLVDQVIGEHQALTGAVALMFKTMLISGTSPIPKQSYGVTKQRIWFDPWLNTKHRSSCYVG